MLDLAAFAERLLEREPEVRAFVEEPGRGARLRREAAELAARFPEPGARPPLYGLLVGVKDIFRVDGLPTRAGSRLPPYELSGDEAECVTALRAAGALVAGKTATTEFAYFAPAPTRNPRALAHTPGGSSSGSAAAVAAGLCDLALGTQTIGSIGRPAAYCGVVGWKPSYERISRAGVFPLAPSVDHVGLFAGDVATIARTAPVVVRGWRDTALAARGARLGVPLGPYLERLSPEGKVHYSGVCVQLRDCGWDVVEVPVMTDFDDVDARHRLIVAAEAAVVHVDLFARFAELYAPKTAELIRRGQGVSPSELELALAGRGRLREELHAAMEERGLDLWISPPATGPAPFGLEATGDPVMNLPWTHAGLPTLVVPAGASRDGLPMGLQLAARFGADEELLALGALLAADLT